MFNRRIFSIILILLIGVSGCSAKESSSDLIVLFDGRYWENTDDYYGEDLVFDLLDSTYLDNRDVFIVQNEMELALLLTIFYQEGAYEVYYVSTQDLDLNRVYSYTLSINEHDIWWEDYIYTLDDGTEINSAEFVYNFEMIHNINQAVDEWTYSYNSSDFTQEDSILFLYNELLERVEYDDDAATFDTTRTSDAFSAQGALLNGLAVCNGYSMAFMALLKDLDIPAMIISSSSDDHAWNMVYINGEWNFFDVTWEDSDGIDDEYFYYYELSLEDLKIDHRFDESNSELLSYDDYVGFAEYVFGY